MLTLLDVGVAGTLFVGSLGAASYFYVKGDAQQRQTMEGLATVATGVCFVGVGIGAFYGAGVFAYDIKRVMRFANRGISNMRAADSAINFAQRAGINRGGA